MMRVICRFKFLTIIVLSFFVLSSKGQIYQVMPQYGYKFNRIAADSTLHIPSYCGVPNITDYIKNGMIAIDTCNNTLFQWTRSSGWTPISTGTYLDTTNLSARINQKADSIRLSNDSVYIIKKVVTQAGTSFVTYYQYKNPYFKTSDTIILSNRINQKLNISDTSVMLSKYLRRSDTGAMLKNYVDFGDTASIVNNYVRKSTTISTTAPLTGGGSLAADKTISIPKATNLVDGYLDDLDWIKFRNNLTNVRPQYPLYRTRFVDVDGYTDSIYIQMFKASPTQDGYLDLSGYNYFFRKVDTIYRDGDSIVYITGNYYNPPYYDIRKIYGGGGGGSGTVTSILTGYGLTSSVNPITTSGQIRVDSTTLKNRFLTKSDTINKFVNRLERIEGKDSIIFYIGSTRYAIKDSAGGGGTGSDTAKVVIAEVYNAEATTLNRGEVVYLYGSNGDRASVKRANNKGDSASSKTFGFVRENILAGQIGYITTQGQIGKLNLGAYTAGQTIYLDSISGQFTATKPSAPYHLVTLGVIERANNGNGLIYVKPANGFELDELHNVQLNGTKNYSLLYYDSTNKLWKSTDSIYAIQGKYLGIGTNSPYTKLDVREGILDDLPRNYEIANFSKNGDINLGIYNAGNYNNTGSAVILGNTKNPNSNAGFPSFQIQNINDSASWDNSVLRYNYFERDISGTVATANIDLFNVYADGTVKMNASTFGSSATSRFIIGADQGETFNVDGTSYITGNSTFDGNIYNTNSGAFYSGKINRMIVEINDGITTNYSVALTDHIIIASTDNDNITITLPEADDGNQSGRELIIKQKGDVANYTLTIDGQGFYIDGSTPRDVAGGADNNFTIKIVCNGNEWFLLQGAFQ